MSSSFIKLDRGIVRVLGLNNAVVFCHLLGIQDSINKKRNMQDAIYQQLDRLIYDTGLSESTIRKCLKSLEQDYKLIHIIKGTERNKNKYLIDKFNYDKLKEIIEIIETKDIKKNKINATSIKQDVLNLYYEWCKNNTTSSDNFIITEKDLKEKEKKLKKSNSNRQLLSNCKHQPITINYFNNGVYDESITYQFIPLLFKDEYTDKEIYNILCNNDNVSKNIHKKEIDTLEYFLTKYYQYYGTIHKPTTAPKVREILQNIYTAFPEYLNYSNDSYLIIDEYFNTPNIKNRDLTIHLFLSKDENGYYSWINTIAIRLGY